MNKTEKLTLRPRSQGQCLRLKTLKTEERTKNHDQRRFESKGIRETCTETRVLFQTNKVRRECFIIL